MEIIISTSKYKDKRHFVASLLPQETRPILDDRMFFAHLETGTRFAIFRGGHNDSRPEEFIFKWNEALGCYLMLSKSGFENDEEHLDWLINLGPITLSLDLLGRENKTPLIVGFISFKNINNFSLSEVVKS